MIEYLELNNVAVINSQLIEFGDGLNVITGETGAGKSLLINSIGILLGDKIDKNLIRKNQEQCKIVAKFFVEPSIKNKVAMFCDKFDIEVSDEYLVIRAYNSKGRNDIKINGHIATLSMIKDFAEIFVDAYFQNDNQKIFNKSQHLQILDDYIHIYDTKDYIEYQDLYNKLSDIKNHMQKFGENEFDRQTKLDILLFQTKEIEGANLSNEEYADLTNKKHIMANVGKIVSSTSLAYNYLSNQTLDNIHKSKSSINQASVYDDKLTDLSDRLDSLQIELGDIIDTLESYNQKYDFSESEQQKIEDRVDLYKKLLRKYSVGDVNELLDKCEEMKMEIDNLQNASERLIELKKQYDNVYSLLVICGERLHKNREKHSLILSEKIRQNISNLGIKNGVVKFQFAEIDYENPQIYKNGLDKVELLFSANLGEEPKELEKTASGGEISRFMLALKAETSSKYGASTIVFDEIDTGISGVAVEQVAKQMAKISKNQQVIVVTHSAQICAMADVNFLIKKTEENGDTTSSIKRLNAKEKIEEVARFLSGDKITDISVANAKELIELQQNYKKSIDK